MATKFTYKNEVGRKWDVGSGTRPTQTKFKKKKIFGLKHICPASIFFEKNNFLKIVKKPAKIKTISIAD
jgi:hypothetical protein